MRPKYATTGIVLSRTALAEASTLVTVLTPDLGLVRARAQGVRKSGAKLASALTTLAEGDYMFVRGREGWRVSGAALSTNWFPELTPDARERVGRVLGLVLRLAHEDSHDSPLFDILHAFLTALPALSVEQADAAECLVALAIIHALGFDAGEIPGGGTDYSAATLASVIDQRRFLVLRVNRGIAASGL